MSRGQGALEYIMMYGIAVLMIVIVGAVLWKAGIFTGGVSSGASGLQEFAVLDHDVKNSTLYLVLGKKVDAEILEVRVNGTFSGVWTGNVILGQKYMFNISLSGNCSSGQLYSFDVSVRWRNPSTGLVKVSKGRIFGPCSTSGGNFSGGGGGAVAWFYNGWGYRRSITVTELSGSDLYNFQVAINITYDPDMQPDFDDLRFTWVNESDGNEYAIPYWVEVKSNGGWVYVWVKIPQIPANNNTTIYVYYGNALASSESNGSEVFDFFDDFDTLDTTVWTGDTASVSVTNSYLNISSSARGIMTATFTITDGVVEAKWYGTSGARGDLKARMEWVGGAAYPSKDSYDINYRIPNGDERLRMWSGGILTVLDYDYFTYTANTWYVAYLAVVGTTVMGKGTEDAPLLQAVDTTYSSGHIGLGTDTLVTPGTDFILYDWVRVRKYANPEPTITIGPEETAP